jgi:integrase
MGSVPESSLYQDQNLVFAGESGELINPFNLRQRFFSPLLERAELPHITFRDLRHTCASLLFQRNAHPKLVHELLGHASVAITLDTYSHMLPGMGGEAATAMKDVLSQDASTVMPTGLSSVREFASPMHSRLAAGPSVTPGS